MITLSRDFQQSNKIDKKKPFFDKTAPNILSCLPFRFKGKKKKNKSNTRPKPKSHTTDDQQWTSDNKISSNIRSNAINSVVGNINEDLYINLDQTRSAKKEKTFKTDRVFDQESEIMYRKINRQIFYTDGQVSSKQRVISNVKVKYDTRIKVNKNIDARQRRAMFFNVP